MKKSQKTLSIVIQELFALQDHWRVRDLTTEVRKYIPEIKEESVFRVGQRLKKSGFIETHSIRDHNGRFCGHVWRKKSVSGNEFSQLCAKFSITSYQIQAILSSVAKEHKAGTTCLGTPKILVDPETLLTEFHCDICGWKALGARLPNFRHTDKVLKRVPDNAVHLGRLCVVCHNDCWIRLAPFSKVSAIECGRCGHVEMHVF